MVYPRFTWSFVLVASFFLAILPSATEAGDTEEDMYDSMVVLNPIIISARRTEVYGGRIAESAVVYTQEQLKKTPARNLSEALLYIPGVDVAVRPQFGQASAVTMRGSESRHVLVMVDGIPFNTQLSGQANPAKIPIEHIERIEVIKGPSSSAWGSSLGGVINVITKDVGNTKVPQGSLTSSFAEFDTFKNSMELSGKTAGLGYLLTGSYFSSDGIRSESDIHESKFFGKASHPLGEGKTLTASFGYTGAKVRDGVTPKSNRIFSQPHYTRYGKVQLDINKVDVKFSAAFKYNNQDITTDSFNGTTGAPVSSTISSNLYKAMSLNAAFDLREEDLLVIGADFDWHTFKTSNFLDTAKSLRTQAPYASYTLRAGKWDFIPGLRFDNNEHFGNQLSPSLGIIYHLKDKNKTVFRGKVARAFNAPPLLWTFNSDPSQLVGPNPDLEAEKGLIYELGAETHIKKLDVNVDLYWMDIKDAISTVFDAKAVLVRQVNFEKFRRQGAEVSFKYNVSRTLQLFASGAFNHVVDQVTKEIVKGNGVARKSIRLGSNYKNDKGFGLYLFTYYDHWDASPSLEPNDQKFILDAKLTQDLNNLFKGFDVQIFLNILNVTNDKYWSSINFPHPGRYFEGGITLGF